MPETPARAMAPASVLPSLTRRHFGPSLRMHIAGRAGLGCGPAAEAFAVRTRYAPDPSGGHDCPGRAYGPAGTVAHPAG
ncbi:hypothetical protein [Streptomyces inhibens]|uniref:hypothetical protein n=1 Tax=Streptomyces inhibens TaxID=2293571 RepID=UPI001EE69385|nr:hypothetical protein [Streptomyces inhibens]UKY52422.1 hypothetical protein KI385_28875 [Streptomyces inhibens]